MQKIGKKLKAQINETPDEDNSLMRKRCTRLNIPTDKIPADTDSECKLGH